ncbi:MAG: cation transporter [Spirochaetales bacterium]|nr:cation transporter [Spirochaetales bacterium]
MSHEHHHHADASSMKVGSFLGATLLNLAITAAEVAGGLISGSLALLSDALHNFSDGFSLVLSYAAFKVSGRARNRRKTFGYKRAGILAAMINSILLISVSVFLLQEALVRLFHPSEVQGGVVILLAFVGVVGNLFSVLLLHRGSRESLNVRAAYLHLLGDLAASFGVIAGGVFILVLHWKWIDPVVSILVSLYIFAQVWGILKKSFNILMQGAPEDFSVAEIEAAVRRVDQVFNIHHVHIWSLDEHELFLEAHLNLRQDLAVSETSEILNAISKILHDTFGIEHTTFQVEYQCCPGVGAIVEEGR